MTTVERQPRRLSANSRNDPYRDGQTSGGTDRSYQQGSSIAEENGREDNEYEEPYGDAEEPTRNERPRPQQDQYIAALQHRFPNRPRTDYAYSRPIGPSIVPPASATTTNQPAPSSTAATTTTTTTTTPGVTGTQRNGGYQTTNRQNTGGTNTLDVSDDRTFARPNLRRVDPQDQNTYSKRLTGETPPATSSPVKPTTPGPNVRINEGNTGPNRPGTSTFNTQSGGIRREQESTFEKVPSQGGPVSYLGTGTFSQFEHCLRDCLERERRQTGIVSQITRHDIPSNIPSYDYCYDQGITSSSAPIFQPSSSHDYIDYSSRTAGTFTIDDIRHINVALSRSGVSLFPYERPLFQTSYPSSLPPSPPQLLPISSSYPSGRRSSGEVVSACRVVEEDPALLYNRNGYQAGQNQLPSSYNDISRSNMSSR